jgi:hypothetical protein
LFLPDSLEKIRQGHCAFSQSQSENAHDFAEMLQQSPEGCKLVAFF